MTKSWKHRMKQRNLPYVYGYLAKWLLKLIALTCRYQIDGLRDYLEIAKKEKCILMLWHNKISMVAEILLRHAPQFTYAAVTSYSRDGEVIDVLVNSYRQGRTIRVPHNSRSTALRTIIDRLKNSRDIIIITPDGPRGPLYQVKPGLVAAAMESAAFVAPMTWSASRYWELPTWDKLLLPKPFSTISVKFGKPIQLQKSGEQLDEKAKFLENLLTSLN